MKPPPFFWLSTYCVLACCVAWLLNLFRDSCLIGTCFNYLPFIYIGGKFSFLFEIVGLTFGRDAELLTLMFILLLRALLFLLFYVFLASIIFDYWAGDVPFSERCLARASCCCFLIPTSPPVLPCLCLSSSGDTNFSAVFLPGDF